MTIPLRPGPGGRSGPRGVGGPAFTVSVLGDFQVTRRGAPVDLPESTWRLVALLAVAGHGLRRARVAVQLWPDKEDERAQANLRSCLYRLRQLLPGFLATACDPLALGAGVRVDLADLNALATRLDAGLPVDLAGVDPALCCADLLPEFYDDFVEDQRELVRQLRLRTLERLARRLREAEDYDAALRLALLAVSQAPMRESAHQLVLEIHLAEGNTSEALRHYQALKNMLWQELGIRPTERMRATMAPWSRTDDRVAAERLGHRRHA